jgi:Mn2+/Fe2+ NRAMP family transporter
MHGHPGASSVIDLFILNALTIVTEFIGLTLGFEYLGVSKIWGVVASAVIIMLGASTRDLPNITATLSRCILYTEQIAAGGASRTVR